MESKSREFTIKVNGQDTSLYFVRPTVSELMQIDLEYRKIYSEAVRAGIMAEAEARKIFKKSGAWDKSDEDKINNLSIAIAQLINKLNEKITREEGMKVATDISTMRNELMILIGQRVELFSNTAEGIANENRIHKLIELCCLRTDTHERFFDSRVAYEKFVQSNKDTLSTMFREAYGFEYGQIDDMTNDWPEVKYLRKITEEDRAIAEAKDKDNTRGDKLVDTDISVVVQSKKKIKKGE